MASAKDLGHENASYIRGTVAEAGGRGKALRRSCGPGTRCVGGLPSDRHAALQRCRGVAAVSWALVRALREAAESRIPRRGSECWNKWVTGGAGAIFSQPLCLVRSARRRRQVLEAFFFF